MIQLVNFLSVLTVPLTQIMELFLQVLLLSKELVVEVLVLGEVIFQARYF